MYKLIIPGSEHVMYVDDNDQKGRSLIRYKGLSQPRIVHFWRTAVSSLNPTLIVDAGVNYGEILLSTTYKSTADIFGIEANISLRPYLSQSLKEHPNGHQIEIMYAFASDQAEESTPFYIDTKRSGNSSAYPLENRPMKKTSVTSITIDSLIPDRSLANDTVLFKLDVEGYEWNALRGMLRVLSQCKEAAGCIEFNITYMEDRGIDIEAFLAFLQQYFSIYATSEQHALVEISPPCYRNIVDYYAKDKACNDLILLSRPELFIKLGL